jgi:hypothetical protein
MLLQLLAAMLLQLLAAMLLRKPVVYDTISRSAAGPS